VLKKRSGRHEETIRQIWFDTGGVHLSEPLEQLRGVFTGVPVEANPRGLSEVPAGRNATPAP
jgi:hypothetical protein